MINTNLVALDVEATGMDPGADHIIELGAVKFRGHQVVERFSTLVRPDRLLSLSIANLTGITNDELSHAPPLRSVLPDLRGFIRNAPIVGQSIAFDLDMLAAAGLRLTNRSYDTYELATILLPDIPSYDLNTIASYLGVPGSDKHRAIADAETSMRVFNELVRRADVFDDQTLDRMIELTSMARSSLAHLFRSIRAERRAEFESGGGSTIGAQLMAKLTGLGSPGPEAMFLVPRERAARLERTDGGHPLEADVVAEILANEGPFSRALENYEERVEQRDMMNAVAHAIATGDRLIVEAGTGTGKSLGYLVPAAMHAARHGEPVVISTATIALQDQLISKDIPALVAAARAQSVNSTSNPLDGIQDLKATVLKGRGNYLCLRRWFIANRLPPSDPVEAELHAKVTAWLHSTETGDRAELRLSPEQQRHWSRLAEEEGACIPGQCVFHRNNQCFLFRARQEAEASHLIIVNHALLLSDLLRGGSVLPSFGHLVVDEAQHLEEEATRQAGYSITGSGLRSLLNRAVLTTGSEESESALAQAFRDLARSKATSDDEGPKLEGQLDRATDAARAAASGVDSFERLLDDVVIRYSDGSAGYERRARLTAGVRSDPIWSQVEVEWDEVASRLSTVVDAARAFSLAIEKRTDDELPSRVALLTDLELIEAELVSNRERGMDVVSGVDKQLISWITKHQTTGELSLHAVPLTVAGILQEELYSRLESLTLTSATLSTDGSFRFIRERLGLQEAVGVQVPSPFDYEASTLVGVADDIPEPNQAGHQKMLQRALIAVCKASGGRAMVLFTSHSALQNSYYAIKPALEREGIQVLGQRIDGSPRQLIERLSEVSETVLLGTNSFWEGVDIVGDALSLLVITRLPFSVPSDPVFAARSEQFDNPFIQYAVPQAILRFKQGFGRLIRSSQDRGVVVILDRRVVSRKYGRSFLNSLPPTNVLQAGHQHIAEAAKDWLIPTHHPEGNVNE